ncbi:MAG: type IV secretory system conjugative DNA transfer family protein [Bosea sp. (in: a-proteobacteria)]
MPDKLREGRTFERINTQLAALVGDPLLAWQSWRSHTRSPALMATAQSLGLTALAISSVVNLVTAIWLWPRPLPRPWDARFATWYDLTQASRQRAINGRHGLLLARFSQGWRLPIPGFGCSLPTDSRGLWRWRQFGRRSSRARDSRHLVVVGSTRSGKGVGVIIPNLLGWRGATLVIDVKGEAFAATAGHRATIGPMFRFAPFRADGRSHRINVLEFVSRDHRFQAAELQKLAAFLLPYPSRESPFWTDTARGLFIGVAAYVLQSKVFEGRRSLATIYDLFSVKGGFTDYLTELVEKEESLSGTALRGLQEYLNIRSDKTQGSVLTQVTNALRVFQNPLFRNATAASDVTLKDLMTRPVTLFIEMSVTEIDELAAPFLRLFLQQLIDGIEREKGLKSGRRLLVVLDEFERIGKLDVICNNFPYISGIGVQIVSILQNFSKVFDVYGPNVAHSLLGSAAYLLVLGVHRTALRQFVRPRLVPDPQPHHRQADLEPCPAGKRIRKPHPRCRSCRPKRSARCRRAARCSSSKAHRRSSSGGCGILRRDAIVGARPSVQWWFRLHRQHPNTSSCPRCRNEHWREPMQSPIRQFPLLLPLIRGIRRPCSISPSHRNRSHCA